MAANRRQHAAEFKAKAVLQVLSGERENIGRYLPNAQVKRQCPQPLVQKFLEPAASIFEHRDTRNEDEQKIAESERLVGRLTIQSEIAKKLRITCCSASLKLDI